MKHSDLMGMSLDQLLARVEMLAISQDEALLLEEYDRFNQLYDEMELVHQELRDRGPAAQLALLRLYDHPNAQVRLKAATMTLAVAPERARLALEDIVASKIFPQAGDAGMLIRGLDDGTFVPT